MALLNLHCHSTYSDGANTIRELALAYKEAGHIALCLTDHSYMLTLDVWERQREEAAEIEKELKFPIIIGLEAFIPNAEEILVFGADACRSLLSSSSLYDTGGFKAWHKTQKDPFALIVAHPYLWLRDSSFYRLMDGYETMNGGLYWGDDYVKKMKAFMPSPRRGYVSQDLHTIHNLDLPCNEVAEDLIIKNEVDLVTYLSVRDWTNNVHLA